MSSQVSTMQESDALIRKLDRINKLDNTFIRDYGGLPATTAYFKSLPIPCWIKVATPSSKGMKFHVAQSNYAYFDAYGVRPENPWEEEHYWTPAEIKKFNHNDNLILQSPNKKAILTVETVFNKVTGKQESLTVYKWAIEYGSTKAVAGAVVDPTYIEKLLSRIQQENEEDDFAGMSAVQIIARLERLSIAINEARQTAAANAEFIKRFFDNSPIPMWISQYVGKQSSPQTAKFPIAQVSKGSRRFKSKLENTDNERLSAITKTIVENGVVATLPLPASKGLKRINWPIFMNGKLTAIGGVMLGNDK